MKEKQKSLEELIRGKMAEHGIQMLSLSETGEDQFHVEGNMLHPVHIGKNTLYVQLPVHASVTKKNEQEIGKIEIENMNEKVKDAEKFVNTLVDNNQLYGFNNQFPQGATHMLEKNADGQMVLKRKGFSIR